MRLRLLRCGGELHDAGLREPGSGALAHARLHQRAGPGAGRGAGGRDGQLGHAAAEDVDRAQAARWHVGDAHQRLERGLLPERRGREPAGRAVRRERPGHGRLRLHGGGAELVGHVLRGGDGARPRPRAERERQPLRLGLDAGRAPAHPRAGGRLGGDRRGRRLGGLLQADLLSHTVHLHVRLARGRLQHAHGRQRQLLHPEVSGRNGAQFPAGRAAALGARPLQQHDQLQLVQRDPARLDPGSDRRDRQRLLPLLRREREAEGDQGAGPLEPRHRAVGQPDPHPGPGRRLRAPGEL